LTSTDGRAAVAFYGSTTDVGDSSADQFPGVWHLYVAETFDSGAHWTTTDTTPALPMQRMGLLRGGGGPADRNLLDFFDINVDKDGRVIVGYVNGCSGGPCSQASSAATGNGYTATASLMRQSSGKRLFQANDPTGSTSKPGMPFVTATRIGNLVNLAWNEADTGNQTITGYDIYRGTASNSETFLTSVGNVTSFTDTTATNATKTYYYQVVAKNASGNSPRRNEISVPFIGDTCAGVVIHRNDPGHPESTGGTVSQPPLPQLLIDYIAVGEPPSTNNLMFKMKVVNLTALPPNSRWRVVWNWVGTAANPNPDEQYFVGMTTDASGTPSFEYGTVATTSLVVLGVPTENPAADSATATAGSSFNPDGTITIFVPKANVGNPQVGDLLGAVNGRTFNTGDTPPNTLERSTLLIDHTFVKGNTDNSYPPATYTIVGNGNGQCSSGTIAPVGAVSRKVQGNAGTFDVDLPLSGLPGVECRQTNGRPKQHTVVITFEVPVTVHNVTVTPASGGTGNVSGFSVANTQVTVNLSNVSNNQVLTMKLNGVRGGTRSGNVAIPMRVLLGDVNASRHVDAADVTAVQKAISQKANLTNYRLDVNSSGHIDATDLAIVQGVKSAETQ
jgi:hypothetical protein